MEATAAFLARIPLSSDGKRGWLLELKARIVAETLIEGATVNGVAKRYGLIPSSVSDWRRMVRMGKLVLPNLDGMDFVPVQIEDPKPLEVVPTPSINLTSVELLKRGVTIRFAADTPATRIAEIGAALWSTRRMAWRYLWPPSRPLAHASCVAGQWWISVGTRWFGGTGSKPFGQEAL